MKSLALKNMMMPMKIKIKAFSHQNPSIKLKLLLEPKNAKEAA